MPIPSTAIFIVKIYIKKMIFSVKIVLVYFEICKILCSSKILETTKLLYIIIHIAAVG